MARELPKSVSINIVDLLPEWTRDELRIRARSRLCTGIPTHSDDSVEKNSGRLTLQRDVELESRLKTLPWRSITASAPCSHSGVR